MDKNRKRLIILGNFPLGGWEFFSTGAPRGDCSLGGKGRKSRKGGQNFVRM